MASIQEILALLGQQVADTKEDEQKESNDSLVIVKKQSLADIMADPLTKPFGWQTEAPEELFTRGEPVAGSLDHDRILKLKRRTPFDDLASETKEAIVELEMQKYAKHNPNCRCKEINAKKPCLKTLLPIQAFVLREISQAQGLIGQIPPGSGKCVGADTEFLDYATGKRRRADEPGTLEVATFNKTLSVASATAFPSGEKSCVKVRLEDGSEIVLSTDHPVLTGRGWIEATQLKLTDRVAAAVQMPEPAVVTSASDDEVKYIAYMLSDGGCSQSQLGFTNQDPAIIEEFYSCATALGYRISEGQSKSNARQFSILKGRERNTQGPGHFVAVEDKLRSRWDLNGLAKNKRTHADVWGLPRHQVALFLNRFWACDGHIAKTHIEITLASQGLIDDIRFLLTRLGIKSSKAYKVASYVKNGVRHKFDAWRLHMSGHNAEKFLFEVGDVLSKEQACQTLRKKLASTKRNTNIDLLPITAVEVKEIFDELGWPGKGRHFSDDPSYGKRGEATQLLQQDKSRRIARSKFVEFCQRYNYKGKYSHLATSDVMWVGVDSVTPAPMQAVYDLNVPGTHNFVANGMVVHNTMLNVLAPLALTNVRSVLLLIPASLRKQLQKDYMMIREHFVVPNIVLHIGNEKPVIPIPDRDPTKPTLHVLPYSRLSMESESNFLVNLQPDAIIADESDAVRSMTSSRGMRLAKWFSGGETPEERQKRMSTKFCGWTGSLIDHSIMELNWPSLFALKNTSPLPLDPKTVEDWARCLDPNGCPAPPGALLDFCEPGESVHSGYGRRLAETPGFIITSDNEIKIIGTDIVVEQDIRERESPELPEIVNTALESVRQGVRPDYMIPGADPDAIEELEDALAIAKAAQQVSNGVLYYWQYPRGESVSLIKEWLLRRRDYNKEVREQALLGETFLDSEKLCRDAARRFYGEIDKRSDRPEWQCHAWPAWRDIMDKVEPLPSSWVMHDFLVDDIQDWLADNTGIVWYSMSAIARRLREKTGLPIHEGGPGAEERLMAEDGTRSIICSISSNGRGRDGLQFSFNKQLLVNPPASQTWFEQVLARSHRRGQKQEVVYTEFYAHTPEVKKAVTQAFKRSAFVRDLMKQRPRLLTGYRE